MTKGQTNKKADGVSRQVERFVKPRILKRKKYIDPEHKLIAEAPTKNMAWMLIRNECHRLGLKVPTIDKIYEYK